MEIMNMNTIGIQPPRSEFILYVVRHVHTCVCVRERGRRSKHKLCNIFHKPISYGIAFCASWKWLFQNSQFEAAFCYMWPVGRSNLILLSVACSTSNEMNSEYTHIPSERVNILNIYINCIRLIYWLYVDRCCHYVVLVVRLISVAVSYRIYYSLMLLLLFYMMCIYTLFYPKYTTLTLLDGFV